MRALRLLQRRLSEFMHKGDLMRLMGLDVGDKTIGVALSDPLGFMTYGLETILRTTLERDMGRIVQLVLEHGVTEVVVGLPLNMNDTIGPRAEKSISFSKQLTKRLKYSDSLKGRDIPVVLWDERLSTVQAEQLLLEADMSRKKRKTVIDKMAAAAFLQAYLEHIKNGGQHGQ